MYITHRAAMKTLKFSALSQALISQILYIPTMPVGSCRSRVAKTKRREGDTGFTKRASAPSPDSSVCCLSDGNTDTSTVGTNSSSNGGERYNQAAAPVEGLQRLYSVFLPPCLQLKEPEDGREKCHKMSKRSAVYIGRSRTTAWRRDVA